MLRNSKWLRGIADCSIFPFVIRSRETTPMRQLLTSPILVLFAGSLSAQPTIGTCPVFPANNIWNQPIDHLLVQSNSATLVSTIGASVTLHADFGSGTYAGAPIG